MRKLFYIILAAALALVLAGCGDAGNHTNGGSEMQQEIMVNGLIREKFEYVHVGELRFIGLDLRANPGLNDQQTIEKIMPMMAEIMSERATEIPEYCYLEHHNGGEVNVNETGIGGYFFKAGTPVPEGLIFYDVPTVNIGYGVYRGGENFGGDLFDAYECTRDKILDDGVEIPYPQAYWTAAEFIGGEPRAGDYRFGYIFGVGEIG